MLTSALINSFDWQLWLTDWMEWWDSQIQTWSREATVFSPRWVVSARPACHSHCPCPSQQWLEWGRGSDPAAQNLHSTTSAAWASCAITPTWIGHSSQTIKSGIGKNFWLGEHSLKLHIVSNLYNKNLWKLGRAHAPGAYDQWTITAKKQIGCFNHKVVTMVIVKLKRQCMVMRGLLWFI